MTNAGGNLRGAGLVFAIFGLVGFGLLVLDACLTARTLLFLRRSSGTVGVVDRLEKVEERKDDGAVEVTYAPVFSFIAANDRLIKVTSRSSSNPPGFTPGEQVPVLYDPRNPEDARIDSYWQMWGMETIVGGIGAVFCIVTLIWSAFARKQIQRMTATICF